MEKPTLLHIQRNFITGGLAEDLVKYIEHTQSRLNHVVLVHYRPGEEESAQHNRYVQLLEQMHVPVLFAQINNPEQETAQLIAKSALAKCEQKIDAVHSWMMNESALGKKIADDHNAAFIPIFGTAHPMEIAPAHLIASIEQSRKALQNSPDPYICISDNIRAICLNEYGFPKERAALVTHGVDQRRFLRSLHTRKYIRQELDIPLASQVIGMAARCDRYKDPKGFLLVAAQLLKTDPQRHFLLAGQGMTDKNPELMQMIGETETLLGVRFGKNLHLLGEQPDMPTIYNAIDLYLHTAVSEPFGLAPVEAKACGVQVAVTEGGTQLPLSAGKTIVAGKGLTHPVRQSQWQLVKHLNGKDVPRPTIEETAEYDKQWSAEFAKKINRRLAKLLDRAFQEIAGHEERMDVYDKYTYADTAQRYAGIVEDAVAARQKAAQQNTKPDTPILRGRK